MYLLMKKTISFFKRWSATVLTIPLSFIFFIVVALSSGAGHGTGIILKLFYAPLYLTQLFPKPDGFAAVMFLFGFGCHIAYAVLADIVKYWKHGVTIMIALFLLHYTLFYFSAQDPQDLALFAKVYVTDDGYILVLAIVLFVVWQMAIITMTRYRSATSSPTNTTNLA